jgi:hypothetical protein
MLAISRAVDFRSRNCGNDGVLLQSVQMLATLRAVDSRSGDCGNDGFLIAMICTFSCHPVAMTTELDDFLGNKSGGNHWRNKTIDVATVDRDFSDDG